MDSITTNDENIPSDTQPFYEVLPADVEIFTAAPRAPHFVKPKPNMDAIELKATIGDPPLSLYLDDYEPTDSTRTLFQVIIDLLDEKSSDYQSCLAARKAAQSINLLYQTTMSDTSDPRLQDPVRFLYGIWPLMFEFLLQMPPDHYAVQRLVDLVVELRKIDVETLNIWGRDIKLWSDLPLLGPEYVEECEQCLDYGNSSLKVFRDLLEIEGYALFDYSKPVSETGPTSK